MPTFSYSPIDLSRDAIRLVRLYKGSFHQEFRCELVETFLSELDGVPYEALSYTWGGNSLEENGAEILLNGQEVSITENLRDALRCLRLQDCDRMLWVDALCIDQANNKEKGHQVGQMRLVYEKAEQVLVWLGPSSDDTESLMVCSHICNLHRVSLSTDNHGHVFRRRWLYSIRRSCNTVTTRSILLRFGPKNGPT